MSREPVLEDLLGYLGFLRAVQVILRLQVSGLLVTAVPCNSFIFLSSSVHQRCPQAPFGDQRHRFVVMGNAVACRCTLLILLAVSRSVSFFLENPARSAVVYWPYIQSVMKIPELRAVTIHWWAAQGPIYT